MKRTKSASSREQFLQFLTTNASENAKSHLPIAFLQEAVGERLTKESAAEGADGYFEGRLIVELKSDSDQWLEAFFQALHYRKRGLTFSAVCVLSRHFVGLWHVAQIPAFALEFADAADTRKAPNDIGKTNANKAKSRRVEVLKAASFLIDPKHFGDTIFGEQHVRMLVDEFAERLGNLGEVRQTITPQNFIRKVAMMREFFSQPMEAIHCFYEIIHVWDATAVVADPDDDGATQVLAQNGRKRSSEFTVPRVRFEDFRRFVESHIIQTNPAEGLTVDYYFSRFDELLAENDPEYVRQHGIFFTDQNLSKFALWFVREYFEKKLAENYIVFDPAGGSGNLVTSWRTHIRHKIVSELNPDLLKIIERRMKDDAEHIQMGFTIVPKTKENKGLNFIGTSAEDYLQTLDRYLKDKQLSFDKPVAFLLNPPYKNTDEREADRTSTESNYATDPQIIALTGEDAAKERYLAFMAQILRLAEELHHRNPAHNAIILVFTPTSWLIPRPTYEAFRRVFDNAFKYEHGFIVTGNQFFKLQGRFPIAFTIWQYAPVKKRTNAVKVRDFSDLTAAQLAAVPWHDSVEAVNKAVKPLVKDAGSAVLMPRGDIREMLPERLNTKNERQERQTRYDFSRAKKPGTGRTIVSGFPIKSEEMHFVLQRKCGEPDGEFLGFMDDCLPVRLKQDSFKRLSKTPSSVWFRLDADFKGMNKTKIFSGAPDNRGYCAYVLASAQATFLWFGLTKAFNGKYPLWANQFDIWQPNIPAGRAEYLYALCFAFGLAENRCVATTFEADNPVKDAPEVVAGNPLAPLDGEAFWARTLDKHVQKQHGAAFQLVQSVKELYRVWNTNYCKGAVLRDVGLDDEPYFRYFSYKSYLTPHSGLIQLRKYGEQQGIAALNEGFVRIKADAAAVREELYRFLVEECRYFE